MFFWPRIAIIVAAAIKTTASIETTVYPTAWWWFIKEKNERKKKIDLHMFFFPFLCFAIPDLDLGILKMLIRECFRDVLQAGVY